jgi:hypothetical protein
MALIDQQTDITQVSRKSYNATKKLRDFKASGTEGLLQCKIRSISIAFDEILVKRRGSIMASCSNNIFLLYIKITLPYEYLECILYASQKVCDFYKILNLKGRFHEKIIYYSIDNDCYNRSFGYSNDGV